MEIKLQDQILKKDSIELCNFYAEGREEKEGKGKMFNTDGVAISPGSGGPGGSDGGSPAGPSDSRAPDSSPEQRSSPVSHNEHRTFPPVASVHANGHLPSGTGVHSSTQNGTSDGLPIYHLNVQHESNSHHREPSSIPRTSNKWTCFKWKQFAPFWC